MDVDRAMKGKVVFKNAPKGNCWKCDKPGHYSAQCPDVHITRGMTIEEIDLLFAEKQGASSEELSVYERNNYFLSQDEDRNYTALEGARDAIADARNDREAREEEEARQKDLRGDILNDEDFQNGR
jgi:hypothetical protein